MSDQLLWDQIVLDLGENHGEIVAALPLRWLAGATAGEREVRKVLRKALFKYQLHQDLELFEKAFGYIRQYY